MYVSVNLGNIMVTKDRVIFIDNNTDLGHKHDQSAVAQLQNPAEKLRSFSIGQVIGDGTRTCVV